MNRPRAALLVALGLAWLNFLFTVKWADQPGALNGWKRPWYAVALAAATLLALLSRRIGQASPPLPAVRGLIAGAWAVLVAAFLTCLPPSSWTSIPFVDDWPPRYVATIEGVRMLGDGIVAGWQWNLLGGYQTSADLSQSLTIVGALPIALFGPAVGYHVLHAIMLAAIPLFVWRDLVREETPEVARLGTFFVTLAVVGYFGTLIPSGDTNSIAGVLCLLVTLAGSRGLRLERRWGAPVRALGLTLALYTHLGFFGYSLVILAVEAAFYRRWRLLLTAAAATIVAAVAALPIYWELLRYPAFFITNNVVYEPGHVDWLAAARQVYYNVEMLVLPHRWFNTTVGLTYVWLPVVLWVAWQAAPRRAGFYAAAALAATGMLMADVPAVSGYLFARAIHLLAVFTPVALAWFVVETAGTRSLALALVAVLGLYVQSRWVPIPHVSSMRDFDASFVDYVRSLDGPLVLVEGNPHRDLIADRSLRTERTPFDTHFDSLLAAETDRRYYAQTWDGWHWTPMRGQTVSGGSFRGLAIEEVPVADFAAEMRKWGVRHLVVWSERTRAYLAANPTLFARRWTSGRWEGYEFLDADVREVVVPAGSGELRQRHPMGGIVALANVRAADQVVVRMNYFPAWRATAQGQEVALRSVDGQLAFDAPASGSYEVRLVYPPRYGLTLVSLTAFAIGLAALWRRGVPRAIRPLASGAASESARRPR